MAFNDLDNNEMASLFSPIVNDPAVKKQFLSIKEIAGLHEQVDEAYQAILAVQPPDVSTDPLLTQIALSQKPIDYRHDRVARVSALALEMQRERALAEDPPNQERADACDAVFAALFPEGTGIINASYRAESGNTERIAKHLAGDQGAATKALLKSIPVDKKETLLDVVGQWIELGAALGKLEVEKAARAAELESEPAPAARVVQQARSQWISLATTLLDILRVSKAPTAVKNAIGHPLSSAATKAGKRAGGKGTPAGAAAPAAPAPPATGTGEQPGTGKPAGG